MGLSLQTQLAIGAGVVLALGAVYVYTRGAGAVAQDVTRGAVNVAGGVVTGAIHGASDLVGVPVPERSKCDQAKAAGNSWEASLYCPAGEFVGYLFD